MNVFQAVFVGGVGGGFTVFLFLLVLKSVVRLGKPKPLPLPIIPPPPPPHGVAHDATRAPCDGCSMRAETKRVMFLCKDCENDLLFGSEKKGTR